MKYINTQYYDDQQFRDKLKSTKNLSMFHLNIRSIPEHFIELTSYNPQFEYCFQDYWNKSNLAKAVSY